VHANLVKDNNLYIRLETYADNHNPDPFVQIWHPEIYPIPITITVLDKNSPQGLAAYLHMIMYTTLSIYMVFVSKSIVSSAEEHRILDIVMQAG